jgi:hypothetical protein
VQYNEKPDEKLGGNLQVTQPHVWPYVPAMAKLLTMQQLLRAVQLLPGEHLLLNHAPSKEGCIWEATNCCHLFFAATLSCVPSMVEQSNPLVGMGTAQPCEKSMQASKQSQAFQPNLLLQVFAHILYIEIKQFASRQEEQAELGLEYG